jgi:hypothetical protein
MVQVHGGSKLTYPKEQEEEELRPIAEKAWYEVHGGSKLTTPKEEGEEEELRPIAQ